MDDENFYYLLHKKIPTKYFDSKFIELETFGKVKLEKQEDREYIVESYYQKGL